MEITKKTTWTYHEDNNDVGFEVEVEVESYLDIPNSKNYWSLAIKIYKGHRIFGLPYKKIFKDLLNREVEVDKIFDKSGDWRFEYVYYRYSKTSDDYLHKCSDIESAGQIKMDVKKLINYLLRGE